MRKPLLTVSVSLRRPRCQGLGEAGRKGAGGAAPAATSLAGREATASSPATRAPGRSGGGRSAYARPYTGIAAPLVGAESSPSRNSITPAISAGLTQRSWSALGIAARLAGVSITLGRIVLQRIPSSLYSTATAFENASTAAFEDTYPAAPVNGCTAARVLTQTIDPPPDS